MWSCWRRTLSFYFFDVGSNIEEVADVADDALERGARSELEELDAEYGVAKGGADGGDAESSYGAPVDGYRDTDDAEESSSVNKKKQKGVTTKKEKQSPYLSDADSLQQCLEWQKKYKVVVGVSWGTLPVDMQEQWIDYSCDFHISRISEVVD